MTETTLLAVLENHGLLGAMLLGMGWFIWWLMKEFKGERREWNASQERRDEKLSAAMKDLSDAIRRGRL